MGKKQPEEPSHEKNNLVSPKPRLGNVSEQTVNLIEGGSNSQFPTEEVPGNNLLPPSDLQGPSSNTKQKDPPQSTPLIPQQTNPSTSSHGAEQDMATDFESAGVPTTVEDNGMFTEASQHNIGTALEIIPLAESNFMSPQPGTSGYSRHYASPQNDPLLSATTGSFISNNLEQVNADIVSSATRTDSKDSENVGTVKITTHDAGGPYSLQDSDEEIPQNKGISQSLQISAGIIEPGNENPGPSYQAGVIEPGNENPGPSYQVGSADSTQTLQNNHLSPQPRPSGGSQKRALSPFQPGPSTSSGNLERDRNAERDSSVFKRMKPLTAEQAGNAPPFISNNNLEQVNDDTVTLATRTNSEDSENVETVKITTHAAGGPNSLPDSDEEIPQNEGISQSLQLSSASGIIEPGNENPGPSYQVGSADSTQTLQNNQPSPQPRPSSGSQKRALSPFEPGPSTSSGNLEYDMNADRDSSLSKRMKPSTSEQAGNALPDGESQEGRDIPESEVERLLDLALEAIENGRFLSEDQLSVLVRAAMENESLWPVLVIGNSEENEDDDNQDTPMEDDTPDGEELESLQDNEFISFYKDPNVGRNYEDNDDYDDPPILN